MAEYIVLIYERVAEDDSDEVKRFGPFPTRRHAEKVEDGVNINLNHERFWTALEAVDG